MNRASQETEYFFFLSFFLGHENNVPCENREYQTKVNFKRAHNFCGFFFLVFSATNLHNSVSQQLRRVGKEKKNRLLGYLTLHSTYAIRQ